MRERAGMLFIRCMVFVAAGAVMLALVLQGPAVAGDAAPDEMSGPETICRDAGGIWLAKFRECSRMQAGKRWCKANSGKFDPCASACRHKPDATACIMVCVPTCTF